MCKDITVNNQRQSKVFSANFPRKQSRFADISKIKSHIDPIEFYEHEGQQIEPRLTRSWIIAGLCPFHADNSAGSFYVHKETGAFRCFSCDAKGGDVIAFMQKKYEMTFPEVIEQLRIQWRVV